MKRFTRIIRLINHTTNKNANIQFLRHDKNKTKKKIMEKTREKYYLKHETIL